MNIFSNIFTPKKKGPPTNSIYESQFTFNVNDDNANEDYESPKKKPRTQPKEYSPDYSDYSEQLFSRAKQGNKFSKANLNMGVDLARRGVLPKTPENRHIFDEMNKRDNLINNRVQREYLEQEKIRQKEFEKLQKEHSENMAERKRQNERMRKQQEEERMREEKERMRQQQEEERIRKHQEEQRRKEEEERQREAERERMRQQYEEQMREEAERVRQMQERKRREEEERKRREEEEERKKREQEQQRQSTQVPQTEIPKTALPEGITDIKKCSAYNVELPKKKKDCNRKIYFELARKLHPSNNLGCIKLSTGKFQDLKNICAENTELRGGKKKTKKYFKKKSNFKISKKHYKKSETSKKSKTSKKTMKKTKRVRSK